MKYKFAIIACLLMIFGSFNVMAGMMFQNIRPEAKCVIHDIGAYSCRGIFGYTNPNNQSFDVPEGVNNRVYYEDLSAQYFYIFPGITTTFEPGTHEFAFFVDFDCEKTIVWNLETWGDEYATISGNSPECQSEPVCGDGIVQPPEECEPGYSNGPCNKDCTIPEVEKLVPFGECVTDNGDGSFTAFWGYTNPNANTVNIPVGIKNFFASLSGPAINQNQGQPTSFLAGTHNDVFATVFTSTGLSWTLDGNTAVLKKTSTPCSTNEIPEFGTIGAAFALAGAGAYLYRKRK